MLGLFPPTTLVGFFHFAVYMTNIYLVGLCVGGRVGGGRRATKKHLRLFLSVCFHMHTPF